MIFFYDTIVYSLQNLRPLQGKLWTTWQTGASSPFASPAKKVRKKSLMKSLWSGKIIEPRHLESEPGKSVISTLKS